MILKKIILKNFRGYLGEHTLDIGEHITSLIGKNDAGKSTILEGLEIFFGEAKPDVSDLNIHSQEKDMLFGCVFGELPESITVDTTAETTLQDEYLLNEDGDFEVVLRFSCTEKTLKQTSTVIRALHPTAPLYNDLLSLKLADLKARGTDLRVSAGDQRVNNSWRKAIWSNAPNLEIRKTELPIDEFDTKVKSIYANLQTLFPQYFLFRVDRQTTDSDSEAKDPMQLAVKEAQKEFQGEISALQTKIQDKVDQVAERALKKLQEMDASLAEKLNPILKSLPKWTFDYKIQDDRGVSLNKRGSGTRRLVLLNFFRAEAEHKSQQHSGNIIYAIEEPETSQHPDNQTLITEALLELAQDTKRQVLITTHSPELAHKLPHDSIRFIEYDESAKDVVIYTHEAGLLKAADSLGILSKQKLGSATGVVVVEGESDELFLKHAAMVLRASGQLPKDFDEAKIIIIPAGGCDNVSFWIQKSRLEELGLPYAIFVDSDRKTKTGPITKNEQLIKDIRAGGRIAVTTRKREIENYIDKAITNGAVYGEFDDAKLAIATANGMIGRKGKPKRVFDTFWQSMTSGQIISCSNYKDASGATKCEILEILNEILSIV